MTAQSFSPHTAAQAIEKGASLGSVVGFSPQTLAAMRSLALLQSASGDEDASLKTASLLVLYEHTTVENYRLLSELLFERKAYRLVIETCASGLLCAREDPYLLFQLARCYVALHEETLLMELLPQLTAAVKKAEPSLQKKMKSLLRTIKKGLV